MDTVGVIISDEVLIIQYMEASGTSIKIGIKCKVATMS